MYCKAIATGVVGGCVTPPPFNENFIVKTRRFCHFPPQIFRFVGKLWMLKPPCRQLGLGYHHIPPPLLYIRGSDGPGVLVYGHRAQEHSSAHNVINHGKIGSGNLLKLSF